MLQEMTPETLTLVLLNPCSTVKHFSDGVPSIVAGWNQIQTAPSMDGGLASYVYSFLSGSVSTLFKTVVCEQIWDRPVQMQN